MIITNLSFRVLQGETLFVRGASGVGKSLLLRCLALLDPLQVGATVPVPLHLAKFASLQKARTCLTGYAFGALQRLSIPHHGQCQF